MFLILAMKELKAIHIDLKFPLTQNAAGGKITSPSTPSHPNSQARAGSMFLKHLVHIGSKSIDLHVGFASQRFWQL
jgi:hypothetical protein